MALPGLYVFRRPQFSYDLLKLGSAANHRCDPASEGELVPATHLFGLVRHTGSAMRKAAFAFAVRTPRGEQLQSGRKGFCVHCAVEVETCHNFTHPGGSVRYLPQRPRGLAAECFSERMPQKKKPGSGVESSAMRKVLVWNSEVLIAQYRI